MSIKAHIGLTGGIGAGKSTAARIFEVLDVPVYYADLEARKLMQSDPDLRREIIKLLGKEAYQNDELNRNWIANQVFNDHNLLSRLNGIVHPAVALHGRTWHDQQSEVPYTLREAALTYESGQFLHLDAVICVEAPQDLRIRRVMERDDATEAQVRARMHNQWPEDRRQLLADYVIQNDGKQTIIPQILLIHQSLISQASKYTHP